MAVYQLLSKQAGLTIGWHVWLLPLVQERLTGTSMQDFGQLDGVVTFWEPAQPLTARLAESLGMPGPSPEAVDAARNKRVS